MNKINNVKNVNKLNAGSNLKHKKLFLFLLLLFIQKIYYTFSLKIAYYYQ